MFTCKQRQVKKAFSFFPSAFKNKTAWQRLLDGRATSRGAWGWGGLVFPSGTSASVKATRDKCFKHSVSKSLTGIHSFSVSKVLRMNFSCLTLSTIKTGFSRNCYYRENLAFAHRMQGTFVLTVCYKVALLEFMAVWSNSQENESTSNLLGGKGLITQQLLGLLVATQMAALDGRKHVLLWGGLYSCVL